MPLSPLAPTRGVWVNLYRTLQGGVAVSITFSTLLLCNLLQMLSSIFLLFSRRVVRTLNRWIAGSWWWLCDWLAERWGISIEISGDDLPERENVMVIANHQAMTDINVLFRPARRLKRIGDLKWFVKDIIKYVPGIGWGMIFLDCIFLKRDWKRGDWQRRAMREIDFRGGEGELSLPTTCVYLLSLVPVLLCTSEAALALGVTAGGKKKLTGNCFPLPGCGLCAVCALFCAA